MVSKVFTMYAMVVTIEVFDIFDDILCGGNTLVKFRLK